MFPDGDTPGGTGVADMAANVWEWTRSDFDKNAKCVRGASFIEGANGLRAATRNRSKPDDSIQRLGFRCVRE
jgi:formylglycine-generating enzyme